MYRIRVWDNFHYQDESESYLLEQEFATLEEAIVRARQIVEESCRENGYDIKQYCMFGEDPAIFGGGGVPFSGRAYAAEVCARERPEAG